MNTLFNENRPCTVEELMNIITAPTGGYVLLPSSAYDEVYTGIYLGEGDSAKSVNCMKRLGVTHVLNAALGKDAYHVNTNHVMYKKKDIEFLGIEATDFINCNLSKYFNTASDFIQEGVRGGGKVFVHCVQGVSRSATLVIAYLMIKHHMTVQDALRLVRSKREICPNPGFLQQLCDLNEQLKKSGHFKERLVGNNPGKANDRIVKTISDDGCVEQGCTVSELEAILTDSTGGLMMLPKTEYNQINDYILIGERCCLQPRECIQL